MTHIEEYSTFKIAKKLRIPRSSLQQYIDRGFIKPSIQKADGRGTKNIFSLNDVYTLKLFQTLHQGGFSQKVASGMSTVLLGKFYKSFEDKDSVIYIYRSKGHNKYDRTSKKNITVDFSKAEQGIVILIDMNSIKNYVDINLKE